MTDREQIDEAKKVAQQLVDIYASGHSSMFFSTQDGVQHDIGQTMKVLLLALTSADSNLSAMSQQYEIAVRDNYIAALKDLVRRLRIGEAWTSYADWQALCAEADKALGVGGRSNT